MGAPNRFDSCAVIGAGVEVRQSQIQGAGNGLWASKDFRRNELITEYVGDVVDHARAQRLREQGRHTHVRVLNSQWLYIDGLKQPEFGKGGGSFANDARDPTVNNCAYVMRFDNKRGSARVFLQATRVVCAGEEVLVSYGKQYWRSFGLEPTPQASVAVTLTYEAASSRGRGGVGSSMATATDASGGLCSSPVAAVAAGSTVGTAGWGAVRVARDLGSASKGGGAGACASSPSAEAVASKAASPAAAVAVAASGEGADMQRVAAMRRRPQGNGVGGRRQRGSVEAAGPQGAGARPEQLQPQAQPPTPAPLAARPRGGRPRGGAQQRLPLRQQQQQEGVTGPVKDAVKVPVRATARRQPSRAGEPWRAPQSPDRTAEDEQPLAAPHHGQHTPSKRGQQAAEGPGGARPAPTSPAPATPAQAGDAPQGAGGGKRSGRPARGLRRPLC